jgi:hypothetical protein
MATKNENRKTFKPLYVGKHTTLSRFGANAGVCYPVID